MYLNYYQLNAKPFQITSDPKFLWLGEKHKEALATLRYGILDNRGFLLLTGEVGTGKTILINRLISMLDVDTVVATLPDPDLISMDFYNLLADGFKMNRTFDSKGAFLIHLRDFLYKSYASRKQVLLVIDESQRLNHHLMEDIRVLSNIELHDRKLINIFFVGQQEFNTILAAPQNRALAQRITVRYHISPLEKQEIDDYIHHRLTVAGSKHKLFLDDAVEEVYQFSGGIPRLINIICDHALLTGYARESKKISGQIIKECAEELRIPIKQTAPEGITSGEAPDTRTIATAAMKSEKEITDKSPATEEKPKSSDQIPLEQQKSADKPSSPFFRLITAVLAVLVVALGAYGLTLISWREAPRYNADDLTPDKYRASLQKEKEILAERMKSGAEKEDASTSSDSLARSALPPGVSNEGHGGRQVSASNTVGQPGEAESGSEGKADRATAKAKPIEAMKDLAPLPLMKEKAIINFKVNSNEIDDRSYGLLDRISEYLVHHPNESVNVRGFTDSSGSSSYNESVSRFRANAVKSYLIAKGVAADKIKALAMGDAFPVGSNDTLEGRSQNRRVEIEFFSNQTQDQ
ncbi:MAG: OmpA family protein [Desulfobacteraceae bacterium]|nr:OmpA family protein [Desulfobacteraceae bacterium]